MMVEQIHGGGKMSVITQQKCVAMIFLAIVLFIAGVLGIIASADQMNGTDDPTERGIYAAVFVGSLAIGVLGGMWVAYNNARRLFERS
ncbi:MAG: hypothetical protein WD187_00415 [Candidatus Woykebacteria bacterium]